MSAVTYLYGFVPPGTVPPRDGLLGLEGREVRVLDLGPLGAVVSELDGVAYAAGSIEQHLKDLAWVADRGARHERVVTWFADHATIAPARFLTVFSSEEALRATAGERMHVIAEQLHRFRHVREWDLKVSYDLETLVSHLGDFSDEAAALDGEIVGAAPGRRYLLERKRDQFARTEAGAVAHRLARDLMETLRPLAEDVAELELPTARADLPVVLNAAFLVRNDGVGAFERAAAEAIRDLERRGVRVGVTGPWAPYRFTGDDAGA